VSAPGRREAACVSFVDIAPTVLEIAWNIPFGGRHVAAAGREPRAAVAE